MKVLKDFREKKEPVVDNEAELKKEKERKKKED